MLSTKLDRARRTLDKHIAAYRSALSEPSPPKGWLRAIRTAIGMTGQQYADRLKIAWQSMADLEKSEAAGTISINSLKKAAEALNCRLVYAVVPASTLEEMVETRSRELARSALSRVDQTMLLEAQATPADDFEERLVDYIDSHLRDGDLWSNDAA
jgi:predicted DNA-binding mobile mystery protein A